MNTDQQDVYSSHPAFSILASALLPSPHEPSQREALSHTSTWNLQADVNDFSKVSRYRNDRQKFFRCGITIGLSYLREWGDMSLQSRGLLGDFSRRLLISFMAGLLSQNEDPEQQQQDEKKIQTTRAFIIHPVHSTMFAPETLFKDLLGCQHNLDDNKPNETMSELQALNLLDRVELLPVHDFSSATQAIGQVSDAISSIREEHRCASTGKEDEDHSEEYGQPPTILLIIEGLDTMAEDVIHNSNAMRGSAILTPVLRTLTHLSRTHTSFLSILLVNTTALGSFQQHTQSQQISATQTSPGDAGGRTMTMATAGGLYSAFARDYTQGKPHHEGYTQPLLNTLLSRTLDQGVDTHLLLQVRRRGQTLVEVIKDRTGDGLGKWCAWRY
ncbi:hypothetical protein EYB25_001481 [Talaromyces marneffei]|nr:uncharacterized protein EYB26_000854 [Talaromyces marneffei]KAE8556777.1 hypothetical protein EYB25_001481 [Talaromyces marneffei]QGA13207.1 hypothetical protein EYB26_000854 [Talaromyces marneffei]